jgi:acyl-CoA thioester hydrolase
MSRAPAVPDRVFTARVPLRWADMDALGHVNNVVFLRLLEEARVQFFAGLAPMAEHGYGVLAARHEIDYLQPLYYSTDPVEVRLWVERIGTASFTVAYVLVAGSAGPAPVCAAAKTVAVAIDPASGATRAVPDGLRERLREYLAA